MSTLRILISEGNECIDRARLIRSAGHSSSGLCDRVLHDIRSDLKTEIFFAADEAQRPTKPLTDYDGILFTGSMSNIQDMTDGTLRQLAFMQEALASGTPLFGICWGLQLATVAAGGQVGPSGAADGRGEWPFAHRIALTPAGLDHPMHLNRPTVFDSYAFHSDVIFDLPPGATVTARNGRCIQALELQGQKSVFWGVQYHPEADGVQAASFTCGFAPALVEAGYYPDADTLSASAKALRRLGPDYQPNAEDRDQLGALSLDRFDFAPVELVNWLQHQVRPAQTRRQGR
ncbi:type 1 glutamine amidotransferase [Sulfitobacter sp. NFXS29]|uniref:type 1 glutamine amidotransferase n=1 Tax=Sulfitobacter sp. NFXS29 TaxID=2818438 RepID=UPI0032E01868